MKSGHFESQRKKQSQLEFGGSKQLLATRRAAGRTRKRRVNRRNLRLCCARNRTSRPCLSLRTTRPLLNCCNRSTRGQRILKTSKLKFAIGKSESPKRPKRN